MKCVIKCNEKHGTLFAMDNSPSRRNSMADILKGLGT